MSHIPIALCVVGALVVLYVVAATWESKELNKKNPTRDHGAAGVAKLQAASVEASAGRWWRTREHLKKRT